MLPTVLCVDRASRVGSVVSSLDTAVGLRVIEATGVDAANEHLRDKSVDCVVTAYDLEDGTGFDVIGAIQSHEPHTPCILYANVESGMIDSTSFGGIPLEHVDRSRVTAENRLASLVNDFIDPRGDAGLFLPVDEAERLEWVARYDPDDLPLGESLDRLTELIAAHFDAGVSFVGLIEADTENFLACHGADWDTLDRHETICTHSMLREDVMVVEDIDTDPRFRDNETLQRLDVVSYAGANMTTPDGHVIGQVCVIDDEPRTYSAKGKASLQQYAATAMEILDLKYSLRDSKPDVSDV
jgi:GAF domain-containing protein